MECFRLWARPLSLARAATPTAVRRSRRIRPADILAAFLGRRKRMAGAGAARDENGRMREDGSELEVLWGWGGVKDWGENTFESK